MKTEDLAVDARDLSKRFGARWALERVNLAVPRGEFLCLFGPNGAGKTTLFRVLSSLLRPTSGSLRLFGKDSRRGNWPRGRLGYLSHRSFLYPHLSGFENLSFYGRLYGLENLPDRIRDRAVEVGILERLEDPVRDYSSGMQRRLSIARALLHDPELLFLDEPFAGLDPDGMGILMEVLSRLRKRGCTVLLITHQLEKGFSLGDRLLILVSGRVAYLESKGSGDLDRFRRTYNERAGARPYREASS